MSPSAPPIQSRVRRMFVLLLMCLGPHPLLLLLFPSRSSLLPGHGASLAQPAIVEGLFVNPLDNFVPPPLPHGMELPAPNPPNHGNVNRKLLKSGSKLRKGEEENVEMDAGTEGGHGRKLETKMYTLNIKNNCESSLYVESYTRVQGQRLPQAPNLKPGASASIQVPSTFRDVELYPFENCTGPNGTKCSSGGCKNNPGTEQCAQGDGHQSQIRFDFRNGQDTYNNNVDTNGFNVPARVVPSNPKCNPMDLTSSSKLNVICDNSSQQNVHFDVTYCPN